LVRELYDVWRYFASAAGVSVLAVAATWFFTTRPPVVQLQVGDETMRPAVGEGRTFAADPAWARSPSKRAVVAFAPPSSPVTLSRAAAVPGDELTFRGQEVLVNRQRVATRVRQGAPAEVGPIRVPRGCVFLVTDGPGRDSMTLGPVPLWRVVGRVMTKAGD
jgi:hypothetical protein